jgi:ferredoxin
VTVDEAANEKLTLSIDLSLCQGHGRCYSNFPDLFECQDDAGKAAVTVARITSHTKQDAQRATAGCPERAISLTAAS